MKALVVAAAAVLFSTASTLAVTVHNRDDELRHVTFDKGVDEVVHPVEAGRSVAEPCPDDCAVRVAGRGHDFLARDGDVLAIEDLVLVRDAGAATVETQ